MEGELISTVDFKALMEISQWVAALEPSKFIISFLTTMFSVTILKENFSSVETFVVFKFL